MATLQVRRATPGDLDALMLLLAELNGEQPAAPPERQASTLQAILADPDRCLLVAVIGDDVIGTADGLVVPNLSRGCSPYMIIENMIVTAGHRGTGAGRALLGALVGLAAERGCYKVQLLSNRARSEAHRFYQRAGFEPCAIGFRRYLADVPRLSADGAPADPAGRQR